MARYHLPCKFLAALLALASLLTPSSSLKPPENCHPAERESLKTFLDGFPSVGGDCNPLIGIECDEATGHVVSLRLPRSHGYFSLSPNSSLFQLRYLQVLDLSRNHIYSEIPDEIGHLSHLKVLLLDQNLLTGRIPHSIGNLRNLTDLNLSWNRFSGKIPDFIGNITRLMSLELSGNKFSGSIPDSFADLRELRILHVHVNTLSGNLPSHIFELPEIRSLDFSNNRFDGGIPTTIRADSNLQFFFANRNHLSGKLPAWLFTAPLIDIQLRRNMLTGPIEAPPSPLATNFYQLHLSHNQISGPIPNFFFHLRRVSELFLDHNLFSGDVEWSAVGKMKYLYELDLSGNQNLSLINCDEAALRFSSIRSINMEDCDLTEFPRCLRVLRDLKDLRLRNNRMTSIDFSDGWCNLETFDASFNMLEGSLMPLPPILSWLSLSRNNLSGEIPAPYYGLNFLDLSHNNLGGVLILPPSSFASYLDLRNNSFHGEIPEFPGRLLKLNLNGNSFEGKLPRSLMNHTELQTLDVGDNNITDSFPNWLDSLPSLSALIITGNNFSGEIGRPTTATPFQSLKVLDASRNKFTGNLPAEYLRNFRSMAEVNTLSPNDDVIITFKGSRYALSEARVLPDDYPPGPQESPFYNTCPAFEPPPPSEDDDRSSHMVQFSSVDFSYNKFSGEIPAEIGDLKLLKGLNLNHNKLSGSIPSSFENLDHLRSLDLSSNMLHGEIPQRLKALEYLNLSGNSFEGSASSSSSSPGLLKYLPHRKECRFLK